MDLARREWAEGLEDLSEEAMGRATQYCRDNLDWPPSIAEFRRAAQESSKRQMYKRNKDAMALPKTPWHERRRIGKREIEKIKKLLA